MKKVGEDNEINIESHRDRVDSRDSGRSVRQENLPPLWHRRSFKGGKGSVSGNDNDFLNKNVTRSVMGVQLLAPAKPFLLLQCQFSALSLKKKQTDIIDIALENYDDIRNNIVKDSLSDLETKAMHIDSLSVSGEMAESPQSGSAP